MRRRSALGAIAACFAAGCGRTTSTPSTIASATGSKSSSGSASASTSTAPPVESAPYPQDVPKKLIANDDLALHDWSLPGDPKISKRCVVLVPRHLALGERVPLLVALHGLAETVDETLGAYAWVDKYGIADGYAHLRAPETMTIAGLGKMISQERLDELHASLASK